MDRATPAADVGTGSLTVADMLPLAARRHGPQPAARHKVDGEWTDLSYDELLRMASRTARGLIALGLQPGDRVAILAQTRVEWASCCFGVSMAGGAVVTVYPTNSAEECDYVLGHSEARFLIAEDAAQLAKIAPLREGLAALRDVVVIDPAGAGAGAAIPLTELEDHGEVVEEAVVRARYEAVRPEEPCVYLYTSGTTGPPKGCEITHWNIRAMLTMAEEGDLIVPDDLTFLYLPLAHAFGLLILMLGTDIGATTAYWERNAARLIANLGEVQPTFFPSVPRIFEKIQALALGGDEDPAASLRRLLGSRLRQGMSGAAPIGIDTLEFFADNGVTVLEGYGMSEMSPLVSVNSLDACRFGSVGRVIAGVEARIAGDGELLLRGPNMFAGYFKNPEATAEAIVDGWLQTGDLARIDDDGYLWITGRKKEVIITAGGKNVSAANIEAALKQCRWISQAIVIGDRRPYLVALLTLDPEEAVAFAAAHGMPVAEVAASSEMRAEVQAAVDRINSTVGPVEQVKRFEVLPEDFSQANGELTPTMKAKRSVIESRYADRIDAIYE